MAKKKKREISAEQLEASFFSQLFAIVNPAIDPELCYPAVYELFDAINQGGVPYTDVTFHGNLILQMGLGNANLELN